MFKLGYQLRPTPVGRLLAAAVGRCAAGKDARSGIGGSKLGGRQVGTVEIDDAETAGDFERASARQPPALFVALPSGINLFGAQRSTASCKNWNVCGTITDH